MPGRGQGSAQKGQFLLQEKTRRRGQVPRQTLRRCMGTVGGAKGIVYVEIGQSRQPGGKLGIVLFFPRMEAGVLQQEDVTGFGSLHCSLHLRTDTVVQLCNGAFKQLREPQGNGVHPQRVNNLALGPAQVRTEDQNSVLLQQIADGGQGCPDAGVVGHMPIDQGHVEIDAHQDPLAPYVQVANRSLVHHSPRMALRGPSRLTGLMQSCTDRRPVKPQSPPVLSFGFPRSLARPGSAPALPRGRHSPTHCRTRPRP